MWEALKKNVPHQPLTLSQQSGKYSPFRVRGELLQPEKWSCQHTNRQTPRTKRKRMKKGVFVTGMQGTSSSVLPFMLRRFPCFEPNHLGHETSIFFIQRICSCIWCLPLLLLFTHCLQPAGHAFYHPVPVKSCSSYTCRSAPGLLPVATQFTGLNINTPRTSFAPLGLTCI